MFSFFLIRNSMVSKCPLFHLLGEQLSGEQLSYLHHIHPSMSSRYTKHRLYDKALDTLARIQIECLPYIEL